MQCASSKRVLCALSLNSPSNLVIWSNVITLNAVFTLRQRTLQLEQRALHWAGQGVLCCAKSPRPAASKHHRVAISTECHCRKMLSSTGLFCLSHPLLLLFTASFVYSAPVSNIKNLHARFDEASGSIFIEWQFPSPTDGMFVKLCYDSHFIVNLNTWRSRGSPVGRASPCVVRLRPFEPPVRVPLIFLVFFLIKPIDQCDEYKQC